jgi:hypothetical protein
MCVLCRNTCCQWCQYHYTPGNNNHLECLQLVPIDRSEEFGVAGAYYWTSFLCFYVKKAWFGGFSFGSTSANDKWWSLIILLYQCCTCTINSSIGVFLLRWRSQAWCKLLQDYAIIQTLCYRKCIFRLLGLLVSDYWSLVLICSCHWSFAELCRMRNGQKTYLF